MFLVDPDYVNKGYGIIIFGIPVSFVHKTLTFLKPCFYEVGKPSAVLLLWMAELEFGLS